MESHKATKPAFNDGATIGPPAKRHLNAVRWLVDDGPLLVVSKSSFISPSMTKHFGFAHLN